MISEKRLAANRQNAQRSTGPRTEEGKAVSRQNSLKHGMTGDGIVLTTQDAEAVEMKHMQFEDWVVPQNPIERELVGRMALASVRMERSRRADAARLEKRTVAVDHTYDQAGLERRQEAVELFANDCTRGYEMLTSFMRGCYWLRDQWKALKGVLDERGSWNDEERDLAQRLSGPDAGLRQELEQITGDSAEALALLRAFVDERIAFMSERGRMIYGKYESDPYRIDLAIALVDTSPEGLRLARYEAMNESSFLRSWGTIQRLRKQEGLPLCGQIIRRAQNEPIANTASAEPADIYDSSYEGSSMASDEADARSVEVSGPAEAAVVPFGAPAAGCEVFSAPIGGV